MDKENCPVLLINNHFYNIYQSKEKELIEESAKDPRNLESLLEDEKASEILSIYGGKLMKDAILVHNNFATFEKIFRSAQYISLSRLKDFIALAVEKGSNDILLLILSRFHDDTELDFLADVASKSHILGNFDAQRILN